MNKSLRQYAKQVPFFLLYNYPAKMKTYEKIKKLNQDKEKEDKLNYNAYRSPSPMNELCQYVNEWEKRKIVWDRSCIDTRCLILDTSYDYSDRKLILELRKTIINYRDEVIALINENSEDGNVRYQILQNKYKEKVSKLHDDETLLANYVIFVSYMDKTLNKSFAWSVYGEYILDNLKRNSPEEKRTEIIEVPYETNETYEYLGKYYILKCGE